MCVGSIVGTQVKCKFLKKEAATNIYLLNNRPIITTTTRKTLSCLSIAYPIYIYIFIIIFFIKKKIIKLAFLHTKYVWRKGFH